MTPRAPWLVVVSAVAGCSVDDVVLEGKQCPCAAPAICNPLSNTCTTAQSGQIEVSNLRAAWVTPETIRWEWDASGDRDRLQSYALVVAGSAQQLDSGTDTTVWTAEQNPELGRYALPRAGNEDQVLATSTDGHAPRTEYVARLFAIDTSSGLRASNIALARTGETPIDSATIYSEQRPAGYALPSCFGPATTAPFSGSTHWTYTNRCEGSVAICGTPQSPGLACWENLAWDAFSLDITDRLGPGAFATAYIEFALAIDGPEHVFWGTVFIHTGNGSPWFMNMLTFASDRGYRRYQVRLTALTGPGNKPLAYEDLQARPITQWAAGGLWSNGATIRVDEVSIRW
jgi:hypothetical protein